MDGDIFFKLFYKEKQLFEKEYLVFLFKNGKPTAIVWKIFIFVLEITLEQIHYPVQFSNNEHVSLLK